jgi:dipeptide/tripeptide permease
MHPTQARIGGLLVVSGFVLAIVLGTGWAMVVGAALLVIGGLVLAVAAEPMLDLVEETAAADETTEAVDPQGGVAA